MTGDFTTTCEIVCRPEKFGPNRQSDDNIKGLSVTLTPTLQRYQNSRELRHRFYLMKKINVWKCSKNNFSWKSMLFSRFWVIFETLNFWLFSVKNILLTPVWRVTDWRDISWPGLFWGQIRGLYTHFVILGRLVRWVWALKFVVTSVAVLVLPLVCENPTRNSLVVGCKERAMISLKIRENSWKLDDLAQGQGFLLQS